MSLVCARFFVARPKRNIIFSRATPHTGGPVSLTAILINIVYAHSKHKYGIFLSCTSGVGFNDSAMSKTGKGEKLCVYYTLSKFIRGAFTALSISKPVATHIQKSQYMNWCTKISSPSRRLTGNDCAGGGGGSGGGSTLTYTFGIRFYFVLYCCIIYVCCATATHDTRTPVAFHERFYQINNNNNNNIL